MRSISFTELVVLSGFVLFVFFVWGRIFSKAGYSGWLSVALLIPLINVLVLGWFACAEWPVTREVAQLRQASASSRLAD